MTRSPPLNASAALQFAHTLADKSAAVTLRYFRKSPAVQNKETSAAAFDPVTAADQAAERAMSNLVTRTFPSHGTLGEEYGARNEEARYTWVFDPIDGTRAFIMGQPLWGTLIALLDNDKPILGVMNQPFTGERFWADANGAFFRHGTNRARRLKLHNRRSLADAILTTTHPDLFQKPVDRRAFRRLDKLTRMTRYGGDCYNYCMLAAGHVDLVVEVDLKPHDIAALVPIVEMAGGRITTWDGAPAGNGGRIVAAGSASLHTKAIAVLNDR